MCKSCAEGGHRCEDHRRLRKLGVDDLRPEPVEDLPDVDWGTNPAGGPELYEAFPVQVAGAAVAGLRRVRPAEVVMTADVVWALPADARPHGLAFRMKSPQSLARKIRDKIEQAVSRGDGVSPAEMVDKLTDLVRYTGVAKTPDEVVPMARLTLRRLKTRGWEVIEVEQSYVEDNPYKGLHCLVRDSRSGYVVEIQFHSEASQAVKDKYHVEYETARDMDQPLAVRDKADAVMRRAWARVPHPVGISTIKTLGGVRVATKAYPRRKGATS